MMGQILPPILYKPVWFDPICIHSLTLEFLQFWMRFIESLIGKMKNPSYQAMRCQSDLLSTVYIMNLNGGRRWWEVKPC